MSDVRYYFALFLVVQAMYVDGMTCDNDAKQHDIHIGRKFKNETLLYHTVVKESAGIFSKTADVSYPDKKSLDGGTGLRRISRVEAIDMSAKGTGGCGYVLSGGVGQTSVVLRLKSQRAQVLHFAVRVFTDEPLPEK